MDELDEDLMIEMARSLINNMLFIHKIEQYRDEYNLNLEKLDKIVQKLKEKS